MADKYEAVLGELERSEHCRKDSDARVAILQVSTSPTSHPFCSTHLEQLKAEVNRLGDEGERTLAEKHALQQRVRDIPS